jgi:hypothetical protein
MPNIRKMREIHGVTPHVPSTTGSSARSIGSREETAPDWLEEMD